MEAIRVCIGLGILLLHASIGASFFVHCEARKTMEFKKGSKLPKNVNAIKHTFLEQMMTQLNLAQPLDSSNTQPYGVSSPFTLTPYDSLPPTTLPENAPPFCVYPPNTPQTPSSTIPSPNANPSPSNYLPPPGPIVTVPGPPESSSPNQPVTVPSPPESVPSPFIYIPSPPGPVLGPPYYEPNPPAYTPSPTGYTPSPPKFLPPIVYPPPTVPPPPHVAPSMALWCVAKPSVPDPIMQEAMNYACGSGADCNSILPSGPCFRPDTLYAHASFAFNSYWQRAKAAGGTCEFGGTAMLVTVDPSYDGCRFDYF